MSSPNRSGCPSVAVVSKAAGRPAGKMKELQELVIRGDWLFEQVLAAEHEYPIAREHRQPALQLAA